MLLPRGGGLGRSAGLRGAVIASRGCACREGSVCCGEDSSAGLLGHVVDLELVKRSVKGGRSSEPRSVRTWRFFPRGALTWPTTALLSILPGEWGQGA